MSVKSRIERLEKKLGKPGVCCCKDNLVIQYPEMPEPDAFCSVCGGTKQIFHFVYEKNWRGETIEQSEPIENWRYALPVSRSNSSG